MSPHPSGSFMYISAPSFVLPFPSTKGGTTKSNIAKGNQKGSGGGGGGSGSPPPQPLSNRALSAITRFNGVMQEEHQQYLAAQGGPTCDKCTAAGRNPTMTTESARSFVAPVASAGDMVRPYVRIHMGANLSYTIVAFRFGITYARVVGGVPYTPLA